MKAAFKSLMRFTCSDAFSGENDLRGFFLDGEHEPEVLDMEMELEASERFRFIGRGGRTCLTGSSEPLVQQGTKRKSKLANP